MTYYLVRVDTSGKQNYIFGSNKLRENIGASHLIAAVTGEWAFNAIYTIKGIRHNLLRSNSGQFTLDNTRQIESKNIDAEVIYSGGGSFLVLFNEKSFAISFTTALSSRVLEEAPGLQLLISPPTKVDWSANDLKQKIQYSAQLTGGKLRGTLKSRPLAGLGVTIMCSSTGLPAIGITDPINADSPGYPASSEIFGKLDVLSVANERLRYSVISKELREHNRAQSYPYEFPSDFDQVVAKSKEFNYIAIVHVDGDGLGKRLMSIGTPGMLNRAYVAEVRQFSSSVNSISQTALQETVNFLAMRQSEGILPIRPLVFGGDDVTFVCDGKLGLTLALEYLRAFQKASDGTMTACAGVAIVKSHYPFSRAYELAEDLCGSAKKFKREYDITGCCLDWHFAQSGLTGDIDFIRDREYFTPSGSLTMRPVALEAEATVPDSRSWNTIQQGIDAFAGVYWKNRRNKVKALRDAFRAGPHAVEAFRLQFIEQTDDNKLLELPRIAPSDGLWRTTGWQHKLCGYFDAIELVDFDMQSQEAARS